MRLALKSHALNQFITRFLFNFFLYLLEVFVNLPWVSVISHLFPKVFFGNTKHVTHYILRALLFVFELVSTKYHVFDFGTVFPFMDVVVVVHQERFHAV